VGIISIFLAIGLTRSIFNHWHKRTVVDERQEALKREEARHAELIDKLEEATSSAFIEKEAREKLGLVREGETIVLLDTSSAPGSTDESLSKDTTPTWKKWWKLFF
jgi:cell division protein FtsB